MDPDTILRLGAAILGLGSVGLFLVHATNERLRGLGWLAAAFAVGFWGSLLLTVPSLPAALVLFGSDLCVLLGFVLLHVAVTEIMTHRHRVGAVSLLLLAIMGLVDALRLSHTVSLAVRVAVLSLAVAVQCLLSARLLFRAARSGERLPAVFSSMILCVFAAYNVIRAGVLLAGWTNHWRWAAIVLTGGYALYIAIALGLAFGFFWMSTAQLSVQLEHMAGTDPLTRLYNRRTFLRACEREFEVSQRKHRPLSILMVDLDHFKSINDQHGHEVGDDALVAAVHSMQDSIRGSDVLARWGGEEFVALLPNANLQAAHVVAERMRANVERLRVPVAGSTGEDSVVRMTISIGIAACEAGENIHAVMRRADKNLYLAKGHGRNRVLSDVAEAVPLANC